MCASLVKRNVPGQESRTSALSGRQRRVCARNALAKCTEVEEPPSEKACRRMLLLKVEEEVMVVMAGRRERRFWLEVRYVRSLMEVVITIMGVNGNRAV